MINKADLILIVLLLIFGVYFNFAFTNYIGDAYGDTVIVSVDREVYGEYDLTTDQVVNVDINDHYNQITIENGSVWFSEANCPDKLCVHSNPISSTSQSTVCLPNKVVIDIKLNDNNKTENSLNNLDSISQ